MIERILALIQERGITAYKLTSDLSFSSATITDWKKGKSKPGTDAVIKIAEYFDVSIEWLMTGKNQSNPPSIKHMEQSGLDVRSADDTWVMMPIYGRVAAGYGAFAYEDFEGYEPIATSIIKGDMTEYFFLRVKGDSMEPEIHAGDLVLIHKQPNIDYSGQIAVVILEDSEGTLKRVYKSDSHIELRSINPNYETKVLIDTPINICGVMNKLVRNY